MALQEFQRRRKFFPQRVIPFIIIEEGHLLHPRIILFLQDSLALSLIKKIIDTFQLIGKIVAIPAEEIKPLIRFQQSCSFLPGNEFPYFRRSVSKGDNRGNLHNDDDDQSYQPHSR